jgi:hypothetical protein
MRVGKVPLLCLMRSTPYGLGWNTAGRTGYRVDETVSIGHFEGRRSMENSVSEIPFCVSHLRVLLCFKYA